VLATLPGERHEFGLLMAYYVTKAAGANCHYLGVDLPPAEIAGACRALEAPVAALSAVVAASHADPGRHLRELRDALPDYAVIWVGGRAAEDVIERAPGVDARPMKSYDRFLLELESG
jgi:methanogenic corrinoid protein MtbC1